MEGQGTIVVMASRTTPQPAPVHRFRPTNGTAVGVAGLLTATAVVVLVLLTERSATGLRVAIAAAGVAVLVWAVLLRPRVVASEETLLLRHALSDVHLPLAAVEDVVVRSTLNVWVGERVHAQ